ncbi:MAG: hypothetical protein ACLTA5_05320 [Anaerococcus obesiensis]
MIYKADYVILEDKIEKDLFVEVEDGKVNHFPKMSQKILLIWKEFWLQDLWIPTFTATKMRI